MQIAMRELESRRVVDDVSFAVSLAHSKWSTVCWGPRRVEMELRMQHRIGDDAIANAVESGELQW